MTAEHSQTDAARTSVSFGPCQCGRPSVVAVGQMAWCYRHVAEAIRLLERLDAVGRP